MTKAELIFKLWEVRILLDDLDEWARHSPDNTPIERLLLCAASRIGEALDTIPDNN